MDREIWRPLPDYEEYYSVSNYGRIMRTKQSRGTKSGKIIKQHLVYGNYLAVVISIECKQKTVRVHRAVARAFVPLVDGKEYVNHKDGNKTNNCASNLEWVTSQENALHSLYVLDNISKRGKLSEEQVISIRSDTRPQNVIAEEYGITQMAVCRIKRGETYKRYGGTITTTNRATPHRLTDEEVLAVKASDKSCKELSKQYGVADTTISRIRKGQRRNTIKVDEYD